MASMGRCEAGVSIYGFACVTQWTTGTGLKCVELTTVMIDRRVIM